MRRIITSQDRFNEPLDLTLLTRADKDDDNYMLKQKRLLLAGVLSVSSAVAAGEYTPYLDSNFPNQVFFGDTHVHTFFSTDAGLFGNTLGPQAAYDFATGKVVTSSLGVKVRLARPLDFLVVSDHSENLGLAPMLAESNPLVMNNEWGKKIAELYQSGGLAAAYAMWGTAVTEDNDPFAGDSTIQGTMSQYIIDAAEQNNNPGGFTVLRLSSALNGPPHLEAATCTAM